MGHSLLKVRKARPDQRWVGATGMDSRKYRICGEAGAELVIPVPTGTTVWHEQYKKALGKESEINCAGDKVLVARGGQGGNPNNQYNGQKGQVTKLKEEEKRSTRTLVPKERSRRIIGGYKISVLKPS
ncbi:GTP-binding protein 10 [Portunus trituberculatus]|uniref:GTP-binding protein 10 n=1 Tax=Portunus trituberculatus TaxID=210409 RepID=A0A5B7FP97_PORTR|nr:GTP-binding protein 10 [Portunus trituberculatus]